MTTNQAKGSDFELAVARLLRSSTGYKNVREQQHIRGKDIDIIFQKQWNPHQFFFTSIATQLLIKVILESRSDRDDASKALFAGLFRGIHMDKLANMARKPYSEYRVASDTEDYFVQLLGNVRYDPSRQMFSANMPELYRIALSADRGFKDEPPSKVQIAECSLGDVKRALRTNHDRDRLDHWAQAMKRAGGGAVFDIDPHAPSLAKSRARFAL